MTAANLILEILTPDGQSLRETVQKVIFRRREKRFELGSEVAVYPLHGPMLLRIPAAPVRYEAGGKTRYLAVAGGFVEVNRNRVLVLTPKFELAAQDEPDPRARVGKIAEAWRMEVRDIRRAMIGYFPTR